MPRALTTIEKASTYLEEACKEMKMDPYSQNGRDRLITGSRGILQGTTAMLVAFDESQVKKLYSDGSRSSREIKLTTSFKSAQKI